MKLVICATLAALAASAPVSRPPESVSSRAQERAHLFSTCAGRFDALATHYRATENPELEQTQHMLSQFEDLAETVGPDAQAAGVPGAALATWRTSGRNDIFELILEVRHGLDLRDDKDANEIFVEKLQLCAQLLLPPNDAS